MLDHENGYVRISKEPGSLLAIADLIVETNGLMGNGGASVGTFWLIS
jgi:hypothetical protein